MPHRDAATYLTEWKRCTGMTDAECAGWVELSVSAFRRQRLRVTTDERIRQTVKLARLHPLAAALSDPVIGRVLIDSGAWLRIALAAADVAKELDRRA